MAIDLLIILVIILLNAIFAGSEIALVSLRPAQVRRIAASNERAGPALVRLTESPSRFLSTVQVGITLGGFLASAVAAVSLAEPVEPMFAFLGDGADIAAVMFVTLVLTYLTLVFGELAPKRIAMQRAEGWAIRVARPLDKLARAASPIVWLLMRSTDAVTRLVGGPSSRDGTDELTAGELRELVAMAPDLGSTRRAIITETLEADDRHLRHVMVPRRDVDTISADTSIRDAIELLAGWSHSRAPLLDGDRLLGTVHLVDLIRAGDHDLPAGSVATPAIVAPESMAPMELLERFRRERRQLAAVLDEHGTLLGIVTFEDIIEELVGEVYDEFDVGHAPDDPDLALHLPDGAIELPGSFPSDELIDLGIRVEVGNHATIAGVVLHAAQRVPDVGEQIEVEEWEFTVLALDGSAIARVLARRT